MGTEVKLKREAIERRIAELEGKMPDIQASKEGAEARATIRRLKARLKTYPQEPKKRIYKVKARFIFDGVFEIRRYWRNIGKAKDIAPQTAAAYERALDKQVEEVADLKYRLSSLTQWRDIQADPKWGFATDDAIDEIFRNLPRLVRDKRDGSIELIDYDNAAEWRGDLERKPSLYQWLPINGNTL